MKILHILYSGLGGHGNVFFSMHAADVQREYQFSAIFNGIEELREEYQTQCEQKNIPYVFIKKEAGKHFSFYKRIRSAIVDLQPDIIFLHGSMAITAAWLAKKAMNKRVKIIVRETQAISMKTLAERSFLKLSMLLADRIVFLSEDYNREIKKRIGGLYQQKKISVIPNGIDLDYFAPCPKPNFGTIQLGMQSRIVSIKDHITLVRSFDRLLKLHKLNVHLQIAGDGNFRRVVEKEVADLGIQEHVTFTGMLKESQLAEFLQGLDIYIHASLGETMSTAIMQAMACGLPVIASDVDGINNMISDNENGCLVPVKNDELLALKILELISDSELKNKLATAARKYAEANFSNKRMFNSYKEIFS